MQVAALSYSVIGSLDPGEWESFGTSVAGFSASMLPGGLALRMDERAGRIFVERAAQNGYLASGWEVRSDAQFAEAVSRLDALGVTYFRGTAAEIALRHVVDMVWFLDPDGNRHEIANGFVTGFERFVSPQGTRFVTGDLGFGHAVLPAPRIALTRQFLADTLGLGLSDFMFHRPLGPDGPCMRIDFLHCGNGRHHSLALFEGEVPSGCVHLMVEVPDIDEVGYAYDRSLQAGARLMATLGKHTNDRMVSFYVATPGGFALEYGFGGKVLDWNNHTAFECTSTSLWGHDFSIGFGADEMAQLADAA